MSLTSFISVPFVTISSTNDRWHYMESSLSVCMIGVDFGPYIPISFRQSMYLLQANKSIRPNPPVYSCCHQQPCLLTKDEHFLSSNITRLLSPHQKYIDNNTMEEKRGIVEEIDDLSGANARTIKRKVDGQKNWKPLFLPPSLCIVDLKSLSFSSWRAACNGANLPSFVRATGVLSITISVWKV